MRDFWTCPLCGAHLDWGEQCDCEEGDDEQSETNIPDFMNNIYNLQNGETKKEKGWQLTNISA